MDRGRPTQIQLKGIGSLMAATYRRLSVLPKGLKGTWSDHPMVDLLVVAGAVGIHAYIVYGHNAGDVLAWAQSSQRTDTYAAGAGISALIGGFTGTAIAQYGSSSGPIITYLRAVHGSKIRRNWLSISRWLMAVAALCVTSMAIDGGATPRGSNWVFEAAFAIALMKFARLIYLFDLIITAVDKQDENAFAIEKANKKHAKAFAGRASGPQDPGIEYGDDY